MTTSADSARVTKVAAELERLGLKRCADIGKLAALKPGDGRGFVVGQSIRIAGYYEIAPSITVHDPELGTLGFVESVSRADPHADAHAWAAIERATAVRQILIEDAARGQRGARPDSGRILPLQVELVLLVADSAPTPDPIRDSLSKVARETGYLRLIGLSVLEVPEGAGSSDEVIAESAMRRAFAWLLLGTQEWFKAAVFQQPVAGWRSTGAGVELELTNYRTAGKRAFSARGSAKLTLVHGHNGSGKSTIAEALELLLTKRIQRIQDAGQTNYFRVVRHRPKGSSEAELMALDPCRVVLFSDRVEKASVSVSADGEPKHTPGGTNGLHVNSFRVDQVFMDKLIRTNAAGRAAIFLNAFAPGDQALLDSLQNARKDVRQAWDALPAHVRENAVWESSTANQGELASPTLKSEWSETEIVDYALRELGSLAASFAVSVTPRALDAILPVERKELQALSAIHAPIGDALKAILTVGETKSLETLLAGLQSALASLSSSVPQHIAALSTALRVFQEFRSWDVGTGPKIRSSIDFEQSLNHWLELQALADLTSRYADVEKSVTAARQRGWPSDRQGEALSKLVPSDLSQELEARRANLTQAVRDARDKLEQSPEGATTLLPAGTSSVRHWLSPSEVDALNHVGQFLASTRGGEPLGTRFSRALADGREDALAEGKLGKSGGLDVAIEQASNLLRACERFHKASVATTFSGVAPLQRVQTLLAAANAMKQRSDELEKSFFHRLAQGPQEELTHLLAAFNELLALLTPARWVYRDVQLRPDLPDGTPSMSIQTSEGAAADLLLNTAELNASALALFLLLAPRLNNELRLLVLDDPLQNMDELTVITVGRTLAKLQGIYPGDWTLLAFLHGAENLQLIRDEAPCDVCVLPWLQSPQAETQSIQAKGADGPCTWQQLSSDLFQARPEKPSRVPVSTD